MNTEKSLIVKMILKRFWQYPVIVILVVLAYCPTFTGGFILDDNPLIKNNKYIRQIHSPASYLMQEDGVSNIEDKGKFHTGYYRPLIYLTYTIDYKIWGMNPAGFRTTNLILHLITCYILFRLINRLINHNESAFWVTLLFALHPVNTESVSWVISRNNILVTLFSLLSLYLYIIWWEKKKHIAWLFSILCFIGAVFSKEFGLMLTPVLFLYHRLIATKKREIFIEILSYIPFALVVLVYFYLRENVTGAVITPFESIQFWKSLYFVPYIIAWNLKLIFAPFGLHYLYVTYPNSMLNWATLLSIGLFLFILITLWLKRQNRIIVYSVLCFFIFLFPVLNIIPSASTSVTLVSMRWLYLPTTFVCLALAFVSKKIYGIRRPIARGILIILAAYFGLYTYVLNMDLWHDEHTFFQQEVVGFNNDFLAGDLAEELFKKGDFENAERYFKVSLEKYPFQAYHYINYSALLIDTGRPEKAISILNEAVAFNLTDSEKGRWFNNMGMALLNIGDREGALDALRKSVAHTPDQGEFSANLGAVYGMMSMYEESVKTLTNGLKFSPDHLQLWTNLAITYINMKKFEKAVSVLESIPLEIARDNESVLKLLTSARSKLLEIDSNH